MASHIVGYPRMGPKRELKFALESFWDGKSSAEELQKVAVDLRSSIWKQMANAEIKFIPSNTFSYYDQVLDTTAMLGAVPPRYGWNGGEIGFDVYFSMARGNASVPAMEMTKWFDTNYHYIVPELGPDVKFSYASHKAVDEYKEAKAGVPVQKGATDCGLFVMRYMKEICYDKELQFAAKWLRRGNLEYSDADINEIRIDFAKYFMKRHSS